MDFRVLDARLMPWRNRFDIVFSNAAFHWIPDHGTLLNAVSRVLKPQGKLVCEFGARFNILRIREAFRTALERRSLPYTTRFYFPAAEEYGSVLEQAGLRPETMKEFDRPTPLKGGPDGLRNWACQFFREDLNNLREEQRIQIFKEMEDSLKDEVMGRFPMGGGLPADPGDGSQITRSSPRKKEKTRGHSGYADNA